MGSLQRERNGALLGEPGVVCSRKLLTHPTLLEMDEKPLCAEVPAGVNSRDTGLEETPNRVASGIVGGSDLTFRRHRRVAINLSVRLAPFT